MCTCGEKKGTLYLHYSENKEFFVAIATQLQSDTLLTMQLFPCNMQYSFIMQLLPRNMPHSFYVSCSCCNNLCYIAFIMQLLPSTTPHNFYHAAVAMQYATQFLSCSCCNALCYTAFIMQLLIAMQYYLTQFLSHSFSMQLLPCAHCHVHSCNFLHLYDM